LNLANKYQWLRIPYNENPILQQLRFTDAILAEEFEEFVASIVVEALPEPAEAVIDLEVGKKRRFCKKFLGSFQGRGN
jgi:hypothetical protein